MEYTTQKKVNRKKPISRVKNELTETREREELVSLKDYLQRKGGQKKPIVFVKGGQVVYTNKEENRETGGIRFTKISHYH